MNTLEDVLAEWQSNLYFRENFKKNPQKALTDVGLTLSESDFKKIKGNEQKIRFDENSAIKTLYVKRPEESISSAKKLFLLGGKEQKKQGYNIIVVNEVGYPRYWTQDNFNTFKKSRL